MIGTVSEYTRRYIMSNLNEVKCQFCGSMYLEVSECMCTDYREKIKDQLSYLMVLFNDKRRSPIY